MQDMSAEKKGIYTEGGFWMKETGNSTEGSEVSNETPEVNYYEEMKAGEGMSLEDEQAYWDLDGGEVTEETEPADHNETEPEVTEEKEVNEKVEYFSTYTERLQQTPSESGERGEWEGRRGESKFVSYDEHINDVLEEHDLDGIEYKDGIPDFSEVSASTVEIDSMSENRAANFKQCDERAVEQWNKEGHEGRNDWTAREIAQWRKENGYSWHERNDMKTCDLVPTEINDHFGHLGGVSECKKRDSLENDGGDFDE